MANKLQVKRGTNLSNAGTPAAGELIYKTDTKKLYVGDGSTAASSLTPIGGASTSGSNNQILTDNGSGGINSESNLTFDGTSLANSDGDVYLNTDNFSTQYRNLWTRLGYGDSGTAYWHKLCRLTITGSYKDYNMKVLWTSRYDSGTLHMHINSDNDNNIDIDYAYVQSDAFLAQSGNVKSNDHFTYVSVDASTVDIWIYTPAWREFDYIRVDSITEGEPSVTFYNESTTTQQTSDPGGTSFTKANVLSSNRFVNGANNRVLTAESADTFRGEGNLTFDGSTLAVTGALTTSSTITAAGNITTSAGHLVLPYGEINDSGTDLNIVGTNAITLQSESGTALTIPNASTNVILEGELFLKDDKDLVLGNNSDLQIKHDNSSGQGWIKNYTDHLVIENNADAHDIILKSDNGSGGTTNYIQLDGSEVETVFNQKIKIEDSKKLCIGTGRDLELYHDGSHSYTRNLTGDLYIQQHANDKDIVFQCDDGSGNVTAYLTIDGGANKIIANENIDIVTSNDEMIRFKRSGADEVSIEQDSSQLYFYNRTTSKVMFLMSETGSAKLGYNSNPDLELRNTATSAGSGPSLTFGHSQSGTASVAKIVSYLTDGSQGGRAGHLDFHTSQGGTMSQKFRIDSDGSLIMNAAEKFYLDGKGDTYLHENAGDSVYMVVGGQNVMRFYETSNVGYAYAPDNFYVGVGSGIDFTMRHDGNNSYLKNTTGNLHIRGRDDGYVTIDSNDGTESIVCDLKSEVVIKHAGTTVFETVSGGIRAHGKVVTANNSGYVQYDAAGNQATVMNQNGSDILFIGDTTHTEQLKIQSAHSTGNGYIHCKNDGGIGFSGNTEFSSPMTVYYGLTINEGGHDNDTRIESDGNANMFRVDASTNRIGIGTGSPSYTLHVSGDIGFSQNNAIWRGGQRHTIGNYHASAQTGRWQPIIASVRNSGRMIHYDEDFQNGSNSVNAYNNAGGGHVTCTRVTASSESLDAPNSSGYVMKIVSAGSAASPGYGGFYQLFTSEASHTFVQIFQAKVPSGYTLNIAENARGNNATSYWLSPNVGTGQWEWYCRVAHSGNGGSFGTSGHVYLSGGTDESHTWYLASCTAYDVSESPGGYTSSDGIYGSPYGKNLNLRRGGNADDRIEIEASETKIYGDTVERVRFGSYGIRNNYQGSAGTPSYSFVDDTDTGMYRHDANTIGFSTGGSVRYTMNNSGVFYASSTIQAGNVGVQIWDGTHGFKSVLMKDTTYTKLLNNDGAVCIYLGDSGDLRNYYNSGSHRFRNQDGSTTWMDIDSNGIAINRNANPNADTNMALNLSGSYGGGIHFTDTKHSGIWCLGSGTEMHFGVGGSTYAGLSSDQGLFMMHDNGDFHADEDVIAFSSSVGSDKKFKKNIKDTSYGLSDVMKMRAVEYDWIKKRKGKHDIGVIAQEIEEIIPEVVQDVKSIGGSEGTHKVVDYGKLASVLIKAIQEQQVQIDELKTKLGEYNG